MTSHNLAEVSSFFASKWVERFLPRVPLRADSKILDLACGNGRHTALALQLGYQVLAVDQQIENIVNWSNSLPSVTKNRLEILPLDLEQLEFPQVLMEQTFDGVIITNYLYRPHLPQVIELIAPDGVLVYETFAMGNEEFGKPSNPEFLLKKDELWQYIGLRKEFSVLAFEQGFVSTPKPAIVQRICATRQNCIGLQL